MKSLLVLPLFTLPLHGVTPLPSHETLLVGRFDQGPVNVPTQVDAAEFSVIFGSSDPTGWTAEMQARQFFRNGGSRLEVVRLDPAVPLAQSLPGNFSPSAISGAGWCVPFSDLGILLLPEFSDLSQGIRNNLLTKLKLLAKERHFIFLIDPPTTVDDGAKAKAWAEGLPPDLDFAALLFPHVLVDAGEFLGSPSGSLRVLGSSGSVAPVVLRKDAAEGLWKAPAGTSALLIAEGVSPTLSAADNSDLTTANICLVRELSNSGVVLFGWRSRDVVQPENRYLSVTRLRRWMSHSLRRGLAGSTARAANDPALWNQLKGDGDQFCNQLFRAGAFAGASPSQAYFTRCGSDTTTQADITAHRVHLIYGFAPLTPSEFHIVNLSFQTVDSARSAPEGVILSKLPGNGTVRLFHPTTPGFTHTIETSTKLGAGTWSSGATVSGDGGWRTAIQPQTPNIQFFRLRTE